MEKWKCSATRTDNIMEVNCMILTSLAHTFIMEFFFSIHRKKLKRHSVDLKHILYARLDEYTCLFQSKIIFELDTFMEYQEVVALKIVLLKIIFCYTPSSCLRNVVIFTAEYFLFINFNRVLNNF